VSPVDDEAVVRAQERIGWVLNGKYRLDYVLGVGGTAAVYAATHRNSKRFAIKMLHPELSMRLDIRTRFLREGYVATQVEHPGAVTVLDDDIAEDGSAFLVMELLEGTTVEALWERNHCSLPLSAVLSIGHQLLDVLASAHARGIVHRDIKPQNLVLTPEAQLKVLDFGIARLKDVATNSTTGTGLVVGTPAFMAPEQAMGKASEIDALTDIWAAGAVLFTLASGRFVHEGETAQQIVFQTGTTPATSLADAWPGAPREMVQLVDHALAFDKSARWPTAGAMQRGVAAVAAATTGSGPSRHALLRLLSDMAMGVAPADGSALEIRAESRIGPPGSTDSGFDEAPTMIHRSPGWLETAPQIAASPMRPAGLITERPVITDANLASPWLARRRRFVRAGAAAVAVALPMSIGALVWSRGEKTVAEELTTAASTVTASAVTVEAPPSRPRALPTPTETLPSIEPATISVDELPRVAPERSGASAVPANPPPLTTPPVGSIRSGPLTAEALPAATAVPTAKPAELTGPRSAPSQASSSNPPSPEVQPTRTDCALPFTLDPATGKKKWKAECL
jgi:eukaryotic-like serine/threonine-protein kinase